MNPRAAVIDLGPGYADPSLLATDLVARAFSTVLEELGPAALAYGADAGPLALRRLLADRSSCADATNIVTTAGTSDAIGWLAREFARCGRSVITESLTYDLGREIFEFYGVPTFALPASDSALEPDELRPVIDDLYRETGRPPVLYLVPTFHNPTGRVLDASLRCEIVSLARSREVMVVADEAYGDLGFTPRPEPTLWALSEGDGSVVELHTFSKTIGPGLRLGWIVADPPLAATVTADASPRQWWRPEPRRRHGYGMDAA